MKLSARNQLAGKVVDIKEGAVAAIVTIDIGGKTMVSSISLDSVKELGLSVGSEVTAIVKATSVMLAVE